MTSVDVSNTTIFTLIADNFSEGLAGYNCTVSVKNPQIALISNVNFPSWAILHDNSTVPDSTVFLSAVDVGETVQAGARNVILGSIVVQGISEGTTNLTIIVIQMDADGGGLVAPSVVEASLFVRREPVTIKGDFNDNGRVDIGDVTRVAYMAVRLVPDDIQADFNGNEIVDSGDAARIAWYYVGKVAEL